MEIDPSKDKVYRKLQNWGVTFISYLKALTERARRQKSFLEVINLIHSAFKVEIESATQVCIYWVSIFEKLINLKIELFSSRHMLRKI